MAAIDLVVDFGMWIMNSKLMEVDSIVRDVVLKIVKHSFYQHFYGGEVVFEAWECIRKINESSSLRGILDFAIEFTSDHNACE